MKEKRAYLRNPDGQLELISVLRDASGETCDLQGNRMKRTGIHQCLVGWPDAEAELYVTAGGQAVYVPAQEA